MSSEKRKPPLHTYREGGIKVTLWEQGKEEEKFVTASVGKLFKNSEGQWREGKSFDRDDLLKLQDMLPKVRDEMQRLNDQYRGIQQENTVPENDMVSAREAAFSQAEPAQEAQIHEQNHVKKASHEPSR